MALLDSAATLPASTTTGLDAGHGDSRPPDGPTSTAVDPTYPISVQTGAPLGDAKCGTDPLVPYGTAPQVPTTPGYVNRNHDEGVTSNGEVDLPF
jgi:hypothetical protein